MKWPWGKRAKGDASRSSAGLVEALVPRDIFGPSEARREGLFAYSYVDHDCPEERWHELSLRLVGGGDA